MRRAFRGRVRRAAQARRAFGRMHGRVAQPRGRAPPEASHGVPASRNNRRAEPRAPPDGNPGGRGPWGAELGRKGAAAKPEGRPPRCSATPTADAGQTRVCPRTRRRAMRTAVAVLLPPSSAPATEGQPRPGCGRHGGARRPAEPPTVWGTYCDYGRNGFVPAVIVISAVCLLTVYALSMSAPKARNATSIVS